MPERTRQAIVTAFNRLIAKAEIEKITTEKIASEAGVSKATFYRYFKDKYDVQNYNYQELLEHALEQSDNYRDLFYLLYSFARDEWAGFRKAFYSTGVNSLENFIYSHSKSVVEQITAQNRGGAALTPEENMQTDVLCCGISYMYKKWTLGQYPLDPDAAADALYALMPESLKHLWFVQPAGTESTLD